MLGFLFSVLILSFLCIFFLSAYGRGTEIYTDDGQPTLYVKKFLSIHYDINPPDNVFMLLAPFNYVWGADPKTFVGLSKAIGKDKKWIYYKDRKQKQVDYETFEVRNGIMRDKNFVYYSGYATLDLIRIEGANPETFVEMELRFAKDDKWIFFKGVKQPQIDRETFEITQMEGEGTEWERIRIMDKNNNYIIRDDDLKTIPRYRTK